MSDAEATNALPSLPATDAIVETTTNALLLMDVREPHEWDAGHSPDAWSVPMSQLTERLAEVPTDRRLAIVCHAGSRSARVTEALIEAGYDAINVEGGMLAWVRAGGEIVSDGPGEPTVD